MYMILVLLIMGAGALVQMYLKNKMNAYSKEANSLGMTGKEVAEHMLADFGIHDVQVMSVEGQLTDHYNPQNKTVNLSELVYASNSITAAAIAAHECGHAVQHAKAYSMLGLRSRLVPLVNFSSSMLPFLLGVGVMLAVRGTSLPLMIGVAFYGVVTLFSIITLPVEFDASNRALAWLDQKNLDDNSYEKAKDGLKWAAMTYVVSAIGTIVNLLYYISLVSGRRN
jgi:hypothetical protein